MVRTSIWLIAIITLITTVLDIKVWYMVYHEGVPQPALALQFSQIGRFIRTLLLLGFVPAIMHSRLSGHKQLFLSFGLAIVADFFLILKGQLVMGIAFFALMQILLVSRHLAGFGWQHLKQINVKWAMIVAVAVWALAMLLLNPGLQATGLFLPVAGYGLLLILSVWAAYTAMYLDKLPLQAARLAFYGLLLFLACDITVGLGAIWEGESRGVLIRALTGIFYGPCLILLGLTGIRKGV